MLVIARVMRRAQWAFHRKRFISARPPFDIWRFVRDRNRRTFILPVRWVLAQTVSPYRSPCGVMAVADTLLAVARNCWSGACRSSAFSSLLGS